VPFILHWAGCSSNDQGLQNQGEPARFGRFSENRSVETQKIKNFEKNVKKLESLRRIVVKKLMK
jgi:hypothetical protein